MIGVLAVQGDFAEHIALLKELGIRVSEVRLPHDLEDIDALIIPGGESTTQRKLLDLYLLTEPITSLVAKGTPLWGTCAGMIIMARELTDKHPEPLGLMDITVTRNAYGRQAESFEVDVDVPDLGEEPYHAIFIRSPAVAKIGQDVEVLCRLVDGTPVALRQGSMLATAFHPELTSDSRFHRYFISMVASKNGAEGQDNASKT
jgi:5'-phosphate synthase pdxT subunit